MRRSLVALMMLFGLRLGASAQGRSVDFANLARYREANTKLPPPAPGVNRVVFMGDSLTENWTQPANNFFPGKPYVGRGISGQTSSQILLRFEQDVVRLLPAVVVLLAGTNDVAENNGPAADIDIEDNLRAMVAIARYARIRVVLSSILPASKIPWRPVLTDVAPRIARLNAWIRSFAAEQHLIYLDYYTAMALPGGAMKPELAVDGFVHPNAAGYAVMAPLAERAIAEALHARP